MRHWNVFRKLDSTVKEMVIVFPQLYVEIEKVDIQRIRYYATNSDVKKKEGRGSLYHKSEYRRLSRGPDREQS